MMMEYMNRISDTAEKAAALVNVLNIAGSGESALQEETLQWYTMVLEDLLDQIREDIDALTKTAAASGEK